MRFHFHSSGHGHFSGDEPPPAWVNAVPPLRHVWVSTGSADGFADFLILGVILLVLVVRFLWRLAGVLAGNSGR
jgi:hypothetical protein